MKLWSRCLVERCCTTDEITADGKSVVEISMAEGGVFDRARGHDLRAIASALVQVCVVASQKGGAAFKIGWY